MYNGLGFDNSFESNDVTKNKFGGPVIKIIGVGGGGGNAVSRMSKEGVRGLEFVLANTDRQVLDDLHADKKVVLGQTTTKGLGAGANPEVGKKAATESIEEIKNIVADADLVFVAAGMGGGTGTGAAPTIAKIAREAGALVVGIVTTPFSFEGSARIKNAESGVIELSKNVDSMILISNDRLLQQFGSIPIKDSFSYADAVLKQAVRTITDLIAVPALINLDFADVKSVMANQSRALIGIGRAEGENKAAEAAAAAVTSPLLEVSIKGARKAIVNITGGPSTTLEEANKAVEVIKQYAGDQVNIIFGVAINESLGEEVMVSIIATGLDEHQKELIQTQEINLSNIQTSPHGEQKEEESISLEGSDVEINTSSERTDEEVDLEKTFDDIPNFFEGEE